jgi:hypothetical protein
MLAEVVQLARTQSRRTLLVLVERSLLELQLGSMDGALSLGARTTSCHEVEARRI